MRNFVFFLLLILLPAVACKKEESKLSAGEQLLIGTWSGTIMQVGYPDFTGTVQITDMKLQEDAGTGSYSSPACDFVWKYLSNTGDKSFQFYETIPVLNTGCVSGRVTLIILDDNRVSYDWTGVDDPQNVASGTFTRQ